MKNKGDKLRQVDRVTYSESIKVNIGNYESKDVFVSLSTDVESTESVSDALLRAKQFVRPELRVIEKKIRIRSKRFVDFDTVSKLKI